MAKQLRWGIQGTGHIAEVLAKAIRESTTGELVAVASNSPERAGRFAAEFGLTRIHQSYEAILGDPDVDVIYIASYHPLHAHWAIQCARAGKHILCEKPLAVNHSEAMAIIEAVRAHDVFFCEAFAYRFTPLTRRLVELVRDGAIGEVRLVDTSYCYQLATDHPLEKRHLNPDLGGGSILDVGCYPVSMARLLAGAIRGKGFDDPLSVDGQAAIGETGVDDYATALLKFESGMLAQVSCALRMKRNNALRVQGAQGQIEIPYPWWSTGGIGLTRNGRNPEVIEVPTSASLYTFEVEAVAEHLGDRVAPLMSWEDSLGNIQVLDQWRRAIGLDYPCERPESRAWPIHRTAPSPRAEDLERMKFGRLARVEKPISRLVMGVDNQPSDAHAAIIFDDFIERGGNCFDCSDHYGRGRMEELLGRWIDRRGIREEIVLLDKGGHTPFCWPEIVHHNMPLSLERLHTDSIDVFMLHRDNTDVPVSEFIDMLNENLQAGRIHAFGASNWTLARIREANAYAEKQHLQGFSSISNNFSLARMVEPVWEDCKASTEAEFLDWHVRTGMPLFAWSSQARGFFTERAHSAKQRDPLLVRSWYADDNFERKRRAEELAGERGILAINIALAFVLCQDFPIFALIGPRTLEETRTSFLALNVELTPTERSWLNLEAEGRE